MIPAVESRRFRGAKLYLGKNAAQDLPGEAIKLADLLKVKGVQDALPPIPQHFGHGYAFGATGWGMFGNGPDNSVYQGFVGCGDCFWAGEAHRMMESTRLSGRPQPKLTGKTVVGWYSDYCGYNAKTGANDQGTNLQEGMSLLQKKGLTDDAGVNYKIGTYVWLDPGNLDQLWAAAYLFDDVGVGVVFQTAQMDQFDSGQPWEYVKGSSDEGGHYVIVPGDNGLISWACRTGWKKSWYQKLNDESAAYIDPLRYNAVTGETVEGHNDMDLEKYVVSVVQLKSSK